MGEFLSNLNAGKGFLTMTQKSGTKNKRRNKFDYIETYFYTTKKYQNQSQKKKNCNIYHKGLMS